MSEPAPAGGSGMLGAFSDMPLVLKGITSFFAIFGAGSVLLSVLPGFEHRVAGETLSQAELWTRGHGILAVIMGTWLAASAAGLLCRAPWARWGVILAYALFLPAEVWIATEPRVALQSSLAVAWAVGAAAYLFRTRGAAEFFRSPG